jgi:3',5'-cyclic AMP phosphodiesterase CpdA
MTAWRTIGRTIWILLAVTGCHSATLYVERRASAGTERDYVFKPMRGADRHYIAFPTYPFVNCVDALAADHGPLHGKLLDTPCWQAEQHTDFVGYRKSDLWPDARASWIEGYAEAAQTADLAQIAALARGIDCSEGPGAHPDECWAVPTWPTAAMSFLHFSDVQIREPEAKLGGTSVSSTLDPLVPSFERDHDQELYSSFVYSAIVDTVNAELGAYREIEPGLSGDDPARAARLAPQFMIHTGDAVDAGLQSEFDQFQVHTDRLDLPWYQVVGNHDALAFGNLRMADPQALATSDDTGERCAGPSWSGVSCTCTRVADLIREYNLAAPDNRGISTGVPKQVFAMVPLLLDRLCILHHVSGDLFVMDPEHYGSTIESFIAAHCRPGAAGGKRVCVPARDKIDYPVVQPGSPCAVRDAGKIGSVLNGFDLGSDRDLLERVRRRVAEGDHTGDPPRRDVGYYCFELELRADARKAWAIVLNTTTTSGAYGELKRSQLDWLRGVLTKLPARDLVLVFAHHPVWDILDSAARDELSDLLTSHRNVVGLFAGHTHEPGLRLIHPAADHEGKPGYHHVWEIIAPAVISFPQQVRQVTLKTTGDVGYLEILSFSPVGTGESAARVERAQAGARRDYCNENRSQCIDNEPVLPSRTINFPRLFFQLP